MRSLNDEQCFQCSNRGPCSVSRVEGSGAATISEVSFQKKFTPDHQVDPSKKQENTEKLRQELKEAAIEMKVLQAKDVRLNKQREVLDGLADKLVAAPASGGEVSLVLLLLINKWVT